MDLTPADWITNHCRQKFLFGLSFVFENVMFDIIYLFIYIFEKKIWFEKEANHENVFI